MRRSMAAALLLVALAQAEAIPVRAPLTTAPPKPPEWVDIRGSTWRGLMYNIDVFMTFQPDGTIIYRNGPRRDGPALANGTWSLSGDQLYFEIANKASEHRATLLGGVMMGHSVNRSNMRADFRLERQSVN